MRPLFLGRGAADCAAALLLASSRQVAVSVPVGSARSRVLVRAGFTPVVDGLHCLHRTTGDRSHLPRKLRQTLARSQAAWQREELHLALTTPQDYGVERLVEEVYYPILVRHLYTAGRSPFGTHNLPQFKALLGRRSVLAVVSRARRTVGAALLQEESLCRLCVPGGEAVELDKSLVGMVYCLTPEFYPANRAFLEILRQAVGYAGWSCLSMGEDTGWIDLGYLPIVNDKLRWSDAVGLRLTRFPMHLKLAPRRPMRRDRLPGALLTWDALGGQLHVRHLGVPEGDIKKLRRGIAQHTADRGIS